MSAPVMPPEQASQRVVGRERELALMRAVLASGGNLVLEGPPGTSKTTLLKAITGEWGIPLHVAEGNGDLSPTKLIGYHDPAAVLREGYRDSNFVAGPLVQAMRDGGFFYLEELNRAPAETLNVLLTAMGDRELNVPRLGSVSALPSFRVVASMNPFDNVGTLRVSAAVQDRFCRLAVDYQDEDAEREIVHGQLRRPRDELTQALTADAVALTRATREHADVRMGSSVRGASDLARVAFEMTSAQGAAVGTAAYREGVWWAMLVALSGRIHVDEASERTPEAVLAELWRDHFGADAMALEPG